MKMAGEGFTTAIPHAEVRLKRMIGDGGNIDRSD
jgi:hypothetical protein